VEKSAVLAKEAADERDKIKDWLQDEEGRLAAQTILLQQALADCHSLSKDKKELEESVARLQKLLDQAEECLKEERRLKVCTGLICNSCETMPGATLMNGFVCV